MRLSFAVFLVVAVFAGCGRSVDQSAADQWLSRAPTRAVVYGLALTYGDCERIVADVPWQPGWVVDQLVEVAGDQPLGYPLELMIHGYEVDPAQGPVDVVERCAEVLRFYRYGVSVPVGP